MVLKIFKILFIFLLIAPFSSCDMGDDDSDPMYDQKGESQDSYVDGIVISQPWWTFSADIAIDTSQVSDTLTVFPSQDRFASRSVTYLFSLQRLAYDVVRSLLDLPANSEYKWMDFSTSNLGTFLSHSDSRPKQWQLDYDVEFQGNVWPYHLLICDLPDGSTEGKTNKAVEFFYDSNFKNGILFFAPSYLNPVMYPEKVMGHGMRCCLFFSRKGSALENVLYVADFAGVASTSAQGNIYLYSRKNNNAISFASIVDMPYLWFGRKEDIGYSVMHIGGIDCATDNVAIASALCPNTTTFNLSESLVREYGVETVMSRYNEQWNAISGQDTLLAYQSPSFLSGLEYAGSGREVVDRTAFSKALAAMEDAKDFDYQISPYKVTIQQIEQIEW